MNSLGSKCVAEFIATFSLTFIGAGAIMHGGSLAEVALAHGLALSMAVYASGHISGAHINPAVTIAMLSRGKISPPAAVGYIIAQLAGAILAALVLNTFFAAFAVEGTKLGATLGSLSDKGDVAAVLVMEIILTFLLVTTIYAVAVDERGAKNVYGFGIGLSVTFGILCGGPLTGASMNPARSFGPALIGGHWDMHWVYWVAPIIGGCLAAWVYDLVLIGGKKNSQ